MNIFAVIDNYGTGAFHLERKNNYSNPLLLLYKKGKDSVWLAKHKPGVNVIISKKNAQDILWLHKTNGWKVDPYAKS